MKPLEELTVLVTGATDGIGLGTAEALARGGAAVLLHGRDAERLGAVRGRLAAETGNRRLRTYLADFAALDAVRRLADAVAADHDRLDVLINNAGIGRGAGPAPRRETSADGHELRFQVNHLAPFLLQRLLLPALRRAAPARIVNVASAGQAPVDFDDVMMERGYEGFEAYCRSKLAMVMGTFELAARLAPEAVTANALHPGTLLDTKMVREGFGRPQGPVETGIEAELHLATAPEVAGITGAYFDRARRARAARQAYDGTARRRLWELSERLAGLAPW